MVIVHVTYRIKPGKREEFMAALAEMGVAECSRKERGCLRYDYAYPTESENQVYLLEVWEDALCLKEHSETPAFEKLKGLKDKYLDGMTIEKYDSVRL